MIHYINVDGIGSAWVAAELEVMQRKGIPFVLHALRPPLHQFFKAEWAQEINRNTRKIYPLPKLNFAISILVAPFLFGPKFFAALSNALFGPRESLKARATAFAHLFVACHWARTLRREKVTQIHSQWIHSAGTVGMYGAWLLGVPFSFTGHAADLFRDRIALLDKIRRAEFIIAISTFHRDFYIKNGADPNKIHIVHCGIDPSQFSVRKPSKPNPRARITSVGRLVDKKGFDLLIKACRILKDRNIAHECVIAGDGPLEKPLQNLVNELQLTDCVTITGKPIHQEDLPAFLGEFDIFAQPCVWAKDNDVDGTPRTLMEAMACGKPSVSARLVGIPDIITDNESGLLVEPNNVEQLADALQRLIQDADLANRLAEGGRQQILKKFEINNCLEPLAALYRARLGNAPRGRIEATTPRQLGAVA